MIRTGKEDLRVKRTKEAIRSTFEKMICEMDYEQISIKELTERAMINRKTFYLHYNTLDELLRELQNEMVQNFTKRTQGLDPLHDIDQITREFFLYHDELGELGEKITCSSSYQYISRRLMKDVMAQTWETDQTNPCLQNIVMTFISQSTLAVYKQWIADGKKIPLEEMIRITTQLIRGGVSTWKTA